MGYNSLRTKKHVVRTEKYDKATKGFSYVAIRETRHLSMLYKEKLVLFKISVYTVFAHIFKAQ